MCEWYQCVFYKFVLIQKFWFERISQSFMVTYPPKTETLCLHLAHFPVVRLSHIVGKIFSCVCFPPFFTFAFFVIFMYVCVLQIYFQQIFTVFSCWWHFTTWCIDIQRCYQYISISFWKHRVQASSRPAEKQSMPSKKSKVPKGWDGVSRIGEQVPGTPFVCFKTPLKPSFGRWYSVWFHFV